MKHRVHVVVRSLSHSVKSSQTLGQDTEKNITHQAHRHIGLSISESVIFQTLTINIQCSLRYSDTAQN